MDGLESVKRLRLLATRPLKARRSLPFALPCEKLLLPFLWDRELLRYTATCRACHSSAHHNGRLELSIVARLPRNLGAYGAQRFAERLDLGSMCSINIDSVTGNASTDKQLESLGCFMVGVGRQANIARNLCSQLSSAIMGSGASTEHKSLIEGKSPEEIAAALKELPPDQLAKIRACMKESCPGPVDCSSITVVAKDYKGMLEQPSAPKFKGALAQIYEDKAEAKKMGDLMGEKALKILSK
eukprot:symbB.v1.2.007317.t3/scaffold447.1/size204395/14